MEASSEFDNESDGKPDISYDNRIRIYEKYLYKIANVSFTNREIDVISCILHNRGEKKIASLLEISYRTVSSHVRNIMNKFSCNSRDDIIDFVEKSGKLQYFKQYYFYLVLESSFTKQLSRIATVINRSKITCQVDSVKTNEAQQNLLQQIKQHLDLANITLLHSKEISENILYNLYIIGNSSSLVQNQKNDIFLLFNSKINLPIDEQFEYINFTNSANYYNALLLLVRRIIDKPEIDAIIEKFKEDQDALKNSLESTEVLNQNTTTSKHKLTTIILIISIATLCSLLMLWFFSQKQHVTNVLVVPTNTTQEGNTQEWNLPPFIEHYTPRHEITDAIWKQFKKEGKDGGNQEERKTAILVGLHGLGGIGKTTLAKNSIHYPKQDYSFKGWFSAETKDLLEADYFELGQKYHLFTNDDIQDKQKIALVKEWFEKQQRILLVYDNVPDMDMLYDYLPNRGDIIITSRNHNIAGAIEVDVMTEDEAIKLLDNLLPPFVKKEKNYYNDLKTLAKTLGYLPLALSQAGAYIVENAITITEYLSLYSTERDKLLLDKTMPAMNMHEPVYITWDISIQKLKQQKNSGKALEILKFIPCCYPENIPTKLLERYLYDKTDNKSIIKLNELLTLLRKYSLIKTKTNSISVHRLVHSWLGSKLSKKKKLMLLKKSVKVIKNIYPWKNQTAEDIEFIRLLLPHGEVVLEQMMGKEILSKKLRLKQIQSEQSQLEQVESHTIHRVSNTDSQTNDTEYVELVSVLGDSYYTLGNYTKSIEMFKQALNINKMFYGKNSVDVANSLYHIGRAYISLGKFTESQELLEKSLAIKQKHHGLENMETIYTIRMLGRAYVLLGKSKKTQELVKKLSIEQKYHSSNAIETANTLHSLGRMYIFLGKYKEAIKSLEKAVIIKQKYYGMEHVEVAHTLHHLGRACIYFGKYKESQELLEKAVIIKQKHYGLEHTETANTLYNLGKVYLYLGKHKESQELLEKSLAIKQKYYGVDHIVIAEILEGLGTYYLILGNYTKAKELFISSYDISNNLHGETDIFSIRAAVNLGNTYRLLKDFKKSKEILELSLVNMEKLHGYDKITTAKIMGNLALLYGWSGDNNKRKDYLKKALVIFKEYLSPDHSDIRQTITNLKNKNDNTHIGYLVILFS